MMDLEDFSKLGSLAQSKSFLTQMAKNKKRSFLIYFLRLTTKQKCLEYIFFYLVIILSHFETY